MVWLMAMKDIKRMLRDRKALAITLLMPAILTTILGFALGPLFNSEFQLEPAKVAIVSYSDITSDREEFQTLIENPMGQQNEFEADIEDFPDFEELLIEEVLSSEVMKEFIQYERSDYDQAIEQLVDGTLTAVIIIPEQFNLQIWLNLFTPFRKNVNVDIQTSPDHEIKAGIVDSIIESYTNHLSYGVVGKSSFLQVAAEFNSSDDVYERLAAFMDSIMTSEQELNSIVRTHVEEKEPINSFQYYAVGMAVMFMMYAASYGASYSVNERTIQTYERLKVAGIPLRSILGGRFVSMFLFIQIQFGLLIVFSRLLFGVYWGNVFHLVIIIVSAGVLIGSLSVLLSTANLIINNERFSTIFESAFLPILALLGGSFVPNVQLPRILQVIGDHTLNGSTMVSFFKIGRAHV